MSVWDNPILYESYMMNGIGKRALNWEGTKKITTKHNSFTNLKINANFI